MTAETPKGVSSRLLSMKFMQRAVASSPSTPESDAPSAKKRKIHRTPTDQQIDESMNRVRVQAAIDEREAQRQAALERHVAKDTHWTLDNSLGRQAQSVGLDKPQSILYVGYGEIDSPDDEEAQVTGRTTTKRPVSKDKAAVTGEASDSSDDNEGDDGNRASKSSQSRTKGSVESVKAKKFRDKRKKKDVSLNSVSSISAGGNFKSHR